MLTQRDDALLILCLTGSHILAAVKVTSLQLISTWISSMKPAGFVPWPGPVFPAHCGINKSQICTRSTEISKPLLNHLSLLASTVSLFPPASMLLIPGISASSLSTLSSPLKVFVEKHLQTHPAPWNKSNKKSKKKLLQINSEPALFQRAPGRSYDIYLQFEVWAERCPAEKTETQGKRRNHYSQTVVCSRNT